MLKKNIKILIGISVFLLLASCKSDPKQSQEYSDDESNLSGLQEDFRPDLSDMIVIPPSMLLQGLEELQINLSIEYVNSTDNLKNYQSSRSQAIALGVYLSDLAYLNYLDNKIELPKYFECVISLSQNLDLPFNFEKYQMEDFLDESFNSDSLLLIVDELHDNVIESFLQGYRHNLVSIISMGSFIETLYLITSNLDEYEDMEVLSTIISDNKIVLDEYVIYASKLIEDVYINKTLKDIEPLISFFSNLKTTSETPETLNSEDGSLVFVGGKTVLISWQDFNNLRVITAEIRNQMLKP